MADKKLTSAKVDVELLQAFKEQSVRDKFSLQKLIDRSLYLYLTNSEFRDKLRTQTHIELS